jgi:hypothetical protein
MNREAYRPPHVHCQPTGRDLNASPRCGSRPRGGINGFPRGAQSLPLPPAGPSRRTDGGVGESVGQRSVEKELHPELVAPLPRQRLVIFATRRSRACSSATACAWASPWTASYRRLRSWLCQSNQRKAAVEPSLMEASPCSLALAAVVEGGGDQEVRWLHRQDGRTQARLLLCWEK